MDFSWFLLFFSRHKSNRQYDQLVWFCFLIAKFDGDTWCLLSFSVHVHERIFVFLFVISIYLPLFYVVNHANTNIAQQPWSSWHTFYAPSLLPVLSSRFLPLNSALPETSLYTSPGKFLKVSIRGKNLASILKSLIREITVVELLRRGSLMFLS